MLPARYRLNRVEGFSSTIRCGKRFGGKVFVIYVMNPSKKKYGESVKNVTKFGVIVGKKQISRAVDRNLLKRRIRHLLYESVDDFPLGSRVVVRILGSAINMNFESLRKELKRKINSALKSLE